MELMVTLTDAEYKDLTEFMTRHPTIAKTPAEALKHFAGLKLYRQLKREIDPKRKVGAVTWMELGVPHIMPCDFPDLMKMMKLPAGPLGIVRLLERRNRRIKRAERKK